MSDVLDTFFIRNHMECPFKRPPFPIPHSQPLFITHFLSCNFLMFRMARKAVSNGAQLCYLYNPVITKSVWKNLNFPGYFKKMLAKGLAFMLPQLSHLFYSKFQLKCNRLATTCSSRDWACHYPRIYRQSPIFSLVTNPHFS